MNVHRNFFDRKSNEGVRDATMVLEVCHRAAQAPEGVDVGELGRDGHGKRGVGCTTIEARTRQARACKEMGDRFHRTQSSGLLG